MERHLCHSSVVYHTQKTQLLCCRVHTWLHEGVGSTTSASATTPQVDTRRAAGRGYGRMEPFSVTVQLWQTFRISELLQDGNRVVAARGATGQEVPLLLEIPDAGVVSLLQLGEPFREILDDLHASLLWVRGVRVAQVLLRYPAVISIWLVVCFLHDLYGQIGFYGQIHCCFTVRLEQIGNKLN